MSADLKLDAFAEWIVASGGERLPPTNEWEVLRYKLHGAVGIVWANKKGAHTLSKQVGSDYPKFIKESGLAPTERIDRLKKHRNQELKRTLRKRDGDCCIYCGQFLTKATLEHFHALSRHGTNHPDNCALACEGCNYVAADLPVIDKIQLRDRIREAVARVAPWEVFEARDWHRSEAAA